MFEQDHSETTERIVWKLGGKMSQGSEKKPLKFGVDADQGARCWALEEVYTPLLVLHLLK